MTAICSEKCNKPDIGMIEDRNEASQKHTLLTPQIGNYLVIPSSKLPKTLLFLPHPISRDHRSMLRI